MVDPVGKYPSGYISVQFHGPTCAKLAQKTGATWRGPIHGTHVLVADDGSVLGHVRTLGIRFPPKDRRYSLRVEGCLFTRIVPLLSMTKPTTSGLAPYDKAKDARKAGSLLIKQMRAAALTPPPSPDLQGRE